MSSPLINVTKLFKEKKYKELIAYIQTNFLVKNSQLLNILAICRILNKRDKNSYIQALKEFKEAYFKEKKTKFGLEALINFINTASDFYLMQSPADDKIFDTTVYLNESISFFNEAEEFFGYEKRLISSIIRVFLHQSQIAKALFYYNKQFLKNDLDLLSLTNWIFQNNYLKIWHQQDYFKYSKLIEELVESFPKEKLIKLNYLKNKKIKIGFLSSDILKKHSITYFLKSVLLNYDKNIFEIILFIDNKIEDQNTLEFISLVDSSFNISGLNNLEALNLVRDTKIDFIIDLMGLTSIKRFSLYKNRVAPTQISWLGYSNTTGLKNMDYIIADHNLILPQEEKNYHEKIIYLPNIWACHSGIEIKTEKNNHPCLKNNFITFGSFNNFSKINEKVVEVWSKILKANNSSKLILKSSNKVDLNILKAIFKKNGVHDSVFFFEKKKLENHFALYNSIDIALDTFPYNGVTTSFEAILMGVPVLTMKGFNFNSRCGESININIGMEYLIAENDEDYVNKATELSKDKFKLIKIRNNIYENAKSSPLFNKQNFSNEFFNALKQINK
jgi:protein O-GlcNAc transferase